jgi:hypothetical protein
METQEDVIKDLTASLQRTRVAHGGIAHAPKYRDRFHSLGGSQLKLGPHSILIDRWLSSSYRLFDFSDPDGIGSYLGCSVEISRDRG